MALCKQQNINGFSVKHYLSENLARPAQRMVLKFSLAILHIVIVMYNTGKRDGNRL